MFNTRILERFYIIHIPEHLILINIFTICNLIVVMSLYLRRSRYESCVRLRVSHREDKHKLMTAGKPNPLLTIAKLLKF